MWNPRREEKYEKEDYQGYGRAKEGGQRGQHIG
jgi:hypothetical protein